MDCRMRFRAKLECRCHIPIFQHIPEINPTLVMSGEWRDSTQTFSEFQQVGLSWKIHSSSLEHTTANCLQQFCVLSCVAQRSVSPTPPNISRFRAISSKVFSAPHEWFGIKFFWLETRHPIYCLNICATSTITENIFRRVLGKNQILKWHISENSKTFDVSVWTMKLP